MLTLPRVSSIWRWFAQDHASSIPSHMILRMIGGDSPYMDYMSAVPNAQLQAPSSLSWGGMVFRMEMHAGYADPSTPQSITENANVHAYFPSTMPNTLLVSTAREHWVTMFGTFEFPELHNVFQQGCIE